MSFSTDSVPDSLAAAIDSLLVQARQAGQRALVVCAGPPQWGWALAEARWTTVGAEDRLWLTARPVQPWQTPLTNAIRLLGQERRLLILDAHAGFSADAFGAASGIVSGGGLLLLLVPPLNEWPAREGANPFAAAPSRFIQHLVTCLEQDPAPLLLQAPDQIRPSRHSYQPAAPRHSVPPCRSADQQQAVATLVELGEQADPRAVVITSDRGRGKSAALGIAAARLLEQHPAMRIGLCAPRPAASLGVFERAGDLLPGASRSGHQLTLAEGGGLQFVAADALLAQRPALDLLLIDEAAALPLPVLQQLLARYPRIAFATTVHGYEGTGRGFVLRFMPLLDQLAPHWQALELNEPIRWQASPQFPDPLEQFVFRALLLDAEPELPHAARNIPATSCRFNELERDKLPGSGQRLRQLFGLLVQAHYRTRPDDLQRLLDAPELRLFTLDDATGRPLAVAVLAREGGFEASIAEAIYRGRRRPQGNLLAQSLAFHAGVPDAARYHYARILRIGVHPDLQCRGLGSTLLQQIVARLESEGELDALGASFSATAELLPFWQRAGLQPVRLGLTREHTSGRHSLLVLKPLSRAGQRVFTRARERFVEHWPTLRAGPLQDLDPALASQLQTTSDTPSSNSLSEADREDLDSFVHGLRGYEVCAWPIEKLLGRLLADPARAGQLAPDDKQLLIRRVQDNCDWPTLCAEFKLKGQKAARRRLREAVGQAWQIEREM